MHTLIFLIIFFLQLLATPLAQGQARSSLPLEKIKLPPGFKISLYATAPGARGMSLGSKGVVFVGTRNEGVVYALTPSPQYTKAKEVLTLASKLEMPCGVAFKDGKLYIAEISKIIRLDDIENRVKNPPSPVVIHDGYPSDKHHGWKFIAFGPDGYLYVPVGAPCNICTLSKEVYASITRIDVNKKNAPIDIFAKGIRNTVGFDWHPTSKELWFTDNGRDWMGDNLPPDELNRAPKRDLHFGFPYCHGGEYADPKYGSRSYPCTKFVAPEMKLGAHVAALGMRFYTGKMFPREYENQIFVAEHGSWNRSTPSGYRVMVAHLKGEKVESYKVFAEGWIEGGKAWGRPVDVLVMPDGSLLVSDDQAGVIYKITYKG
ncbi:MAG: sorbosone dehydrogenase family protein [Oligoflexia bacterium]|nr:sorbosone dehydrogenase family protein [Oligoflexia bacterium]MBF0366403.1 sorbosone dehydrogenase family protein [Oligoflexia bacterium]